MLKKDKREHNSSQTNSEAENLKKNKDDNSNKSELKKSHELELKVKKLEQEISSLKQTIGQKTEKICLLEKQIETFNNNYKNEVLKKAQEAQNQIELKIKEQAEKTEAEIKRIKKYALKDSAVDLIQIINNFNNALAIQTDNPGVKNFLMGFEMFASQFRNFLTDNNIHEIQINQNDLFDQNTMEPLEVVENSAFKSNHVIKVIKKGYKLHDFVIVHATVIVAK